MSDDLLRPKHFDDLLRPKHFELLSTAPHELSGYGVIWPDGSVTLWTERNGAMTHRNAHGFEHRMRFTSSRPSP